MNYNYENNNTYPISPFFRWAIICSSWNKYNKSPRLFHIDALSNSTDDTDDVIVTSKGNIGVGTLTPQTKLDIISPTPGAIKIADGTQGVGKVLSITSMDGRASWTNIVGGWLAMLINGNLNPEASPTYRRIVFTDSYMSQPNVGKIILGSSRIIVPYTGTYRLTAFGKSLMTRFSGYYIAGYLRIISGSSIVWGAHSLGNNKIVAENYFSYSTFLPLTKNQPLDIWTNESAQGYANAIKDVTFMVEYVQ